MVNAFADEQEFEEHLDFLVREVGEENLQKMEILIYLPSRKNNLFWKADSDELSLSIPLKLAKRLGAQIRLLNWSQFESYSSFKGYLYYEFNQGWAVKDTFVLHKALSLGATLLSHTRTQDKETTPSAKTVPLSPYHQLVVSDFADSTDRKKAAPYYQKKLLDQYVEIFTLLERDKRLTPIWPLWLEAFCKANLSTPVRKFF